MRKTSMLLLVSLILFVFFPEIRAQAPVATDATNITQVSFQANWTPSSAVPAYYLMVATDASFTNIVPGYNNLNVGSGTSFVVSSGLTPNTLYYYKVGVAAFVAPYVYSNVITLRTGPLSPVANAADNITTTGARGSWNSVENSVYYTVRIARNSAFTEGLNTYGVESGTSYTFTGLSPSTQYFYNVRAQNSYGGTSSFSNVISFTTSSNLPDIPVAYDAGSVTNNSFYANWNASSNSTGYYMDVSTVSNFASFITGYENVSVGNVLTYQVTGLSPGVNYHFRVRGTNSNGTSGNSNVVTVLTKPNAPVATDATNRSRTGMTANWNAAAGAEGYSIEVAADGSFTGYVTGYQNLRVGNVTTLNITGLTANTQYFYRVRGYNSGGESINSNVVSATTLPNAPAAPAALSAQSLTQTGFTAMWNAVSGVTGYYLDVATDINFGTILAGYNNLDVGNNTAWGVTGLTANTQYFYRLRGYNLGGPGSNSNIITVTTLPNAPAGPVATAATNIRSDRFTANWNASAGASSYKLEVAIDNQFQNMLSNYSNIDIGNVTSYEVTGLTPNNNYFYRIRSANAAGVSGPSNVVSVTTLMIVPPAPTALPGTKISNTSFSANWSQVTSAQGYYLEVATDAGFANILPSYNGIDAGNVSSYTVSGINYNTNYYYRVRGYNTGGAGAYSNTINMYILVGIEDDAVPAGYMLYQNYPNPFNPETNIKFSLKKQSDIRLILYDAVGREAGIIAEGFYPAGMNLIRFDASKLANGIYFYRLITPEYSSYKKMVLLK